VIPNDLRRAVLAEAGDRALSRASVEALPAETTDPKWTRRDATSIERAPGEPRSRPGEQSPPARDGHRRLRVALSSRGGLRRAVLLQEILGRPKALRTHGDDVTGA
jgi:hypothetical protein